MKFPVLFTLISVVAFSTCNQRFENKADIADEFQKTKSIDKSSDKEEIQTLIRQALKWADSENSIELLPAISDNMDSVYRGFDFNVIDSNLEKLEQSGFFPESLLITTIKSF